MSEIKEPKSHNIHKTQSPLKYWKFQHSVTGLSTISPGTEDWTKDAELHKRYTDWRQEVQLILETILSNVKDAKTMVKYVTQWARKEA